MVGHGDGHGDREGRWINEGGAELFTIANPSAAHTRHGLRPLTRNRVTARRYRPAFAASSRAASQVVPSASDTTPAARAPSAYLRSTRRSLSRAISLLAVVSSVTAISVRCRSWHSPDNWR